MRYQILARISKTTIKGPFVVHAWVSTTRYGLIASEIHDL